MGKTVPDPEYTAILMGSLPKSYSNIIGQISASGIIRAGHAQDEALVASTQKKGKKRDIECFNCHKKGHTRAQCWAKGGGNEGGGPKQRNKKGSDDAKTATADETSQDIESWAMIDALGDSEDDGDDGDEPAVATDDSTNDSSEGHADDDHLPAVVMESFEETCERSINARPIHAANNEIFHAIGMGDLQITLPLYRSAG